MTNEQLWERVGDTIKADETGESLDDVMRMIDILANERAEARGRQKFMVDDILAASFLCEMFRPLKLFGYVQSARNFRLLFSGIAQTPAKQDRFRRCLKPEVLAIESVEQAVAIGFNHLFDVHRARG